VASIRISIKVNSASATGPGPSAHSGACVPSRRSVISTMRSAAPDAGVRHAYLIE
jgi:hypothetical protein